jgi:hypothetical protein
MFPDLLRAGLVLALFLTSTISKSSELRDRAIEKAFTESSNLAPEPQADLLLRVLSLDKNGKKEARLLLVSRVEASAESVKDDCAKAKLLSGTASVLAPIDPSAALAKIASYKGTCPSYWADAALRVFPLVISRCSECVDLVSQAAVSLGANGEYPYRAMAEVVSEAQHSQPEIAKRLLIDLIGWYGSNDVTSWKQHQRFFEVVDRFFDLVPTRVARQAFDSGYRKVRVAKNDLINTQTTVLINGGSVAFTDRDAALSALSRLAKRFDSEVELKSNVPGWIEPPTEGIAGGIQSASSKQPAKFIRLILDLNQKRALVSRESTDQEIESAPISAFLKAALTAVRAEIADPKDSNDTNQFFSAAEKRINALDDSTERLIALSAYVDAAEKQKDERRITWGLTKMFALADSEYKNIDPKPANIRNNYVFAILNRSITRSLDGDQTYLFEAISTLREPELRGFLYAELVYRIDN